MYGDDRGYTDSGNLRKGGFFLLIWPIGWLTLIAIAAINTGLARYRPLLTEYARYASAIAIGMLLPEIISLVLQRQEVGAVAIDVGAVLLLVTWLALAYSRLAAVLLALFEAIGIVIAVKAKLGAGTGGFLFIWAIAAIVVVRLAVVALVGLSLRRGMKVDLDSEVLIETFA